MMATPCENFESVNMLMAMVTMSEMIIILMTAATTWDDGDDRDNFCFYSDGGS